MPSSAVPPWMREARTWPGKTRIAGQHGAEGAAGELAGEQGDEDDEHEESNECCADGERLHAAGVAAVPVTAASIEPDQVDELRDRPGGVPADGGIAMVVVLPAPFEPRSLRPPRTEARCRGCRPRFEHRSAWSTLSRIRRWTSPSDLSAEGEEERRVMGGVDVDERRALVDRYRNCGELLDVALLLRTSVP